MSCKSLFLQALQHAVKAHTGHAFYKSTSVMLKNKVICKFGIFFCLFQNKDLKRVSVLLVRYSVKGKSWVVMTIHTCKSYYPTPDINQRVVICFFLFLFAYTVHRKLGIAAATTVPVWWQRLLLFASLIFCWGIASLSGHWGFWGTEIQAALYLLDNTSLVNTLIYYHTWANFSVGLKSLLVPSLT